MHIECPTCHSNAERAVNAEHTIHACLTCMRVVSVEAVVRPRVAIDEDAEIRMRANQEGKTCCDCDD